MRCFNVSLAVALLLLATAAHAAEPTPTTAQDVRDRLQANPGLVQDHRLPARQSRPLVNDYRVLACRGSQTVCLDFVSGQGWRSTCVPPDHVMDQSLSDVFAGLLDLPAGTSLCNSNLSWLLPG